MKSIRVSRAGDHQRMQSAAEFFRPMFAFVRFPTTTACLNSCPCFRRFAQVMYSIFRSTCASICKTPFSAITFTPTGKTIEITRPLANHRAFRFSVSAVVDN